MMYAHGQGVRRDEAEAMRWFSKAAEQDEDPAKFMLELMEYHHAHGIPIDSEAVKDVSEKLLTKAT